MTNEEFNRPALIKAGVALTAVAVLANIPYGALIALFDYDDVLRRPASEVLELFYAGGSTLVFAWWTFALSAFGFAVAAMLLGEALKNGKAKLATGFTQFGVLSGVIQASALLRWTFAIPGIATTYVQAAEGSAERAAAISSYEALNTFAGVGMGEHLGQVLHVHLVDDDVDVDDEAFACERGLEARGLLDERAGGSDQCVVKLCGVSV